MNDFIACCGLDCEKCDAFIATVNDDNDLRKKTAELWSKMNGVTITPDEINCEGCRKNGKKTVFCADLCPIRQCVLKRGFFTCGDCAELNNCQTVGMIVSDNEQALKNLKG